MTKLLSFLTLLCLSSFVSAQNASVIGQVIDPEGESLPMANVLLMSAADSSMVKAALSSDNGSFEMIGLGAGSYWLKISYAGMKAFSGEIFELKNGEKKDLSELILGGGTELETVTIQEEVPIITVRPDMTIFNVNNTINAIGENAFNLLRKAPGVMIDNNENIMLLGKSGVRIYINGKPSPLGAQDLALFLRSVQSSEIENIEIITNPSSKYEAEGNAGIINIKMKRDKRLGTNGNVNLGYSIGRYSKYRGGLNLNYRNKKFNAFGSYNYNPGKTYRWIDPYREQVGLKYEGNSTTITDFNVHSFRGGLDYYLNEKSTLGVQLNGYVSDRDQVSDSRNEISWLSTDSLITVLLSDTEENRHSQNVNANLSYRFDDKKGQKWNIDLDYSEFRNDADMYQPNYYMSPNEDSLLSEAIFSTDMPSEIDMYIFTLDHERPLWDGVLGVGVKTTTVLTDNTFNFYDHNNGEQDLNLERSNRFEYLENVNAAYFNYQRKINKWGIQAGLRVEQTNSLGELTANVASNNDEVKRNYLDWFPSGGLTYQYNQKNVSRMTYSRRIDRPRYQDLNPFEYKLDELTYRAGNPFLRPQYTHNIQYSHTYNYTFTATLGYSHTSDFFTEITDTTEGTRSFMTKRNLTSRDVVTLTASYPWSPTKWWSTYTNAGVYYSKNQADFGEGKEIDISRPSWSIYNQQTFKLPLDFSIQLSGWYRSPNIWGANFKNSAMWGIEAGVQKKFFDDRGLLKIAVSDVFHTMSWRGVQEFGGLYMDVAGGWESRQLKIDFSYLFGNTHVKSNKRKTGNEDAQKRAGNGGGR